MTIAGLLIVGAIGYGLWYLGGAFCKWRLPALLRKWGMGPEQGKKGQERPISRADRSFARSGLTNH
jgi:hypothetical protein